LQLFEKIMMPLAWSNCSDLIGHNPWHHAFQ